MALTRIGNQAITLDAAEIPNLDASKITTGTLADARISASSVTQHSAPTDLQPIKSDISALALREATNESSAAFNLPNQFIDTFATDTLGTKTNVFLTTGYINTISGTAEPSNTVFYLKGDQADGNTTFTDSKGNITLSIDNTVAHSNSYGKVGSTSISKGNNAMLYASATSHFLFGTGEFNIEFWYLSENATSSSHRGLITQGGWGTHADQSGSGFFLTSGGELMILSSTNNSGTGNGSHGGWDINVASSTSFSTNTWYHLCTSRGSDGKIRIFIDGVEQSYSSTTGQTGNEGFSTSTDSGFKIGANSDDNSAGKPHWYFDNMLIAKGSGAGRTANFTPPTDHYGLTVNATGTAIQATNTVGSAKTKVGGTILYKDNAGTATLGTDLKIYFTCNGGTNWTEASSYSAITPVYSTGIKQVRLGETTCTSGTDVRYKAVWANQASGSKETQLHGIGVNY